MVSCDGSTTSRRDNALKFNSGSTRHLRVALLKKGIDLLAFPAVSPAFLMYRLAATGLGKERAFWGGRTSSAYPQARVGSTSADSPTGLSWPVTTPKFVSPSGPSSRIRAVESGMESILARSSA
jgi:hypothetical protein